jgi:hypothetical protein
MSPSEDPMSSMLMPQATGPNQFEKEFFFFVDTDYA